MRKVLCIVPGGIARNGITLTQLQIASYLDKEEVTFDFAAVHNNDKEVMKEILGQGFRIIEFPDRVKHLFQYILFLNNIAPKYDVIHVHGSSSLMVIELLIGKIQRVKLRIAHCHNTSNNHVTLDRLFRPVFRHTYNMALACGREAGKFLFGDGNFSIVYNGKDLDTYKFSKKCREKIRRKYGCENKTVIGFIGNFIRQKNIPFLCDIINKFKNDSGYRFIFVGDGPEQRKLENTENQANVVIPGRVDDITEMYSAFDLFILPSLYEGLPAVIVEAQAMGLKCLVSDAVTDECRLTDLVEFLPLNNGIKPWEEQIRQTDRNSNREELSYNAHKKMKEKGFDIKDTANRIQAIYLGA